MTKKNICANWLYFIGTKQNPVENFVYGLSVPTKCPKEYSLNIEDKGAIEDGKHLYLFRSVKNITDYIENDNINLSIFYNNERHDIPNRKDLQFIQTKEFIQKYETCPVKHGLQSPINSLVNLTCYYTKKLFEANLSNETIINLLKKLAEDTSQNFYGDYARRIGCFEIVKTKPWAETNCPFYIEYNKEDKQYFFIKSIDFNEDLRVLFKCYYSTEEKVYEKLVFIPKDNHKFLLNDSFDDDLGFEYSVYNMDGDLLHEDYAIFLKRLTFNSTISGGSIKINDKFSQKDNNLSKISRNSEFASVVKNPNINAGIEYLNDNYDNLLNLIKEDTISEKEGRWFIKSNDLLSDIVNYLNSLHTQSSNIIIIDPYADDDTLHLSIRLKTSNIKVISSNKAIPSKDLINTRNKIEKIKKQLHYSECSADAVKYYFINKMFHDRFIIFKTGDIIEVYCLPNSLNTMLKNDDFLILRLNGKVKLQAISHINNLNSLCKEENLLENLKNDTDE
jgi:hypothetical protein